MARLGVASPAAATAVQSNARTAVATNLGMTSSPSCLSNDHVDRPRRANASQRSGPTCCYAARHSFTTTLAPCCFRPEAGDHDGCHNHDATGQATGQRGDECAVALEGRVYRWACTDDRRYGDDAGNGNVNIL